MKNFLDYNKKINKEDNTFQKLMVIYKMAIKELNTKVEIIKEEYKLFYNYDLICQSFLQYHHRLKNK